MDKRGFAIKIIISIVVILILISTLTLLLNKKDKITGQITSEIQKTDNKVEEIVIGEEAKQANNKINEFPKESDLNNNFANNNSNNTERNQTYYLQLLKNNKSSNVSVKKQ